jgi:hypothetical protein
MPLQRRLLIIYRINLITDQAYVFANATPHKSHKATTRQDHTEGHGQKTFICVFLCLSVAISTGLAQLADISDADRNFAGVEIFD